MHGLASIRKINSAALTEEDLAAARRSAAAKPVTVAGKDTLAGKEWDEKEKVEGGSQNGGFDCSGVTRR